MLFELRDEICIFLKEEVSDLAHNFYCNKFLMNLAYHSDMLLKLSEVNLQLQGTNTHLPHLAVKITPFIRNLDMWLQRVKVGKVDSFDSLTSFTEDKLQNTMIPHISALQKHFQKYFLIQDPEEYD